MRSERELLLMEMDRLRLVMAKPERYWQDRHSEVNVAGLVELGRKVEADWARARGEDEFREVRIELSPRLRGLGFELPEDDIGLQPGDLLVWRGTDLPMDARASGRILVKFERTLRALADGIGAFRVSMAAEDVAVVGVTVSVAERGPLDGDQLKRLAEIAAKRRLHREVLLKDHAGVLARLPDYEDLLGQHHGDLIDLNDMARDAESGAPLRDWLAEAVWLLGPRVERREVEAMVAIVARWVAGQR